MQHSLVIVDDHLLIAKALTNLIEAFDDFNVLYEAANGKVLIEKMQQYPDKIPDVILMEIIMPVMDGFATTKWIKDNYPRVLVMALSMQDDDSSIIGMIKNGAQGYVHKNIHPSELELALRLLIAKGFYYPDWAAGKMLGNISKEEKISERQAQITEREKEFLQYATTELTYKEIAEKMFCSPRTVEGYRNALFEKLDLRTRVGLVVYAIKKGIVTI